MKAKGETAISTLKGRAGQTAVQVPSGKKFDNKPFTALVHHTSNSTAKIFDPKGDAIDAAAAAAAQLGTVRKKYVLKLPLPEERDLSCSPNSQKMRRSETPLMFPRYCDSVFLKRC